MILVTQWTVLLLLLSPALGMVEEERLALREKARAMFHHSYDNYMEHAFPHDELRPVSETYTDSLMELGNLNLEHLSPSYNGTALTLVESLSTLAVLGNTSEFEKGVSWLSENLSFDIDVRVNVFECTIRHLGGLLSAHMLASDPDTRLMPGGYSGRLLALAQDLGERLLRAFTSPTGIPYAWVNLRHGVRKGETPETSTAGCGSLILEMGTLSRLTGRHQYEDAALWALRKLWAMRSPADLMGTTLNVETGQWIEFSGGIGAGVDSFYEYLLKAYILFDEPAYWASFHKAYLAAQRFLRTGNWYQDADLRTGRPTHRQFGALQAFWPGLQVLAGDVEEARRTHRQFFAVWETFGVFPERYYYDGQAVHHSENYYPLRPELAESTYLLYQATRDPLYLKVGKTILTNLNRFTKVPGGYTSLRSAVTKEKEDHQHSYFLSETCKYLYLLFDPHPPPFLRNKQFVFTTEGHILPLGFSRVPLRAPLTAVVKPPCDTCQTINLDEHKISYMSLRVCPNWAIDSRTFKSLGGVESICHIPDGSPDHRCKNHLQCGVDAASCRHRTCSPAGFCN
ncbi:Glycosyl hydrolase family 47 [Klebsormidium nitens]|uniref:alpha-1,2-Mannosidase n=1 Tax=Klebsormidium nitens TaxID=105231 RepID=A0A1Y1I1V9_KLENI|nr:Glycosyl hydrolase family 47 [Klebsormidium nitens]|eukprot:GAQ84904.1 Glycosyl hydrolase family 47 [Klebsormidium nitens]